jgi:hypothetical protein
MKTLAPVCYACVTARLSFSGFHSQLKAPESASFQQQVASGYGDVANLPKVLVAQSRNRT